MILAAVAWFAVQAHSAALPFALAMFLWILWTQFRQGRRALQTTVIEAAIVVLVLQIPTMFAKESIRPTKIVAAMQEPQELRAGDSYRAVNDAVGSIGFAPFAVPQPTLVVGSVLNQLLGTTGTGLSGDDVKYMDLIGNNSGALDVGDFLAWVNRTNAVPPASPPDVTPTEGTVTP